MQSEQNPEAYLGDGVYASFDGWNIWLATRVQTPVHTICLEPEVIAALVKFMKSLGWKDS